MKRQAFDYLLFFIFLPLLIPSWAQAIQPHCSLGCKSIPPDHQIYTEFGPPYSSQQELSPDRIDVFVWNIHKGVDEGFNEDFSFWAQSSDLVLIQETRLNTPIFQTLTLWGHHYEMSVSFLMSGDEPTGVSTGSQVAPTFTLPQRTKTLEPFVKTPKTNMITKYKIKGTQDELLVVNIHGINRRQTKELVNQIQLAEESIRQHLGPVIFAGDFNTRNKSRQKQTDQIMADWGLIPIVFQKDSRKKKLDHIYYRGLQLKESALLTLKGSDHPALKALFQVDQ